MNKLGIMGQKSIMSKSATSDELIKSVLEYQPDAGSGDESKCLISWINTLSKAFVDGNGYSLSHGAVSALLHTLICAKLRTERLVRERDNVLST
jgi:hypothetical protein